MYLRPYCAPTELGVFWMAVPINILLLRSLTRRLPAELSVSYRRC